MRGLSPIQLGSLFALAVVLFITGFGGVVANSYIVSIIGVTLAGILLLMNGILLNSINFKEKSKAVLWFAKVMAIGFSCILFIFIYPLWADFSNYIRKDFVVLQGYPTKITYYEGGTSRVDSPELYVTIEGKEIYLYPPPMFETVDELYQKHFIIEFLPETEWILNIEMK